METPVNSGFGYLMAYSGLFRLIPVNPNSNLTPIAQSRQESRQSVEIRPLQTPEERVLRHSKTL